MSKAGAALTRQLLFEAREELTRADSKATFLLGGIGVAIDALMAGLIANSWSPTQLHNGVEWVWWLGGASVAAGVTSLLVAVYPRTRREQRAPGLVAYYGDVVKAGDDLAAMVEKTAADASARPRDQLALISQVVLKKYRAIKFAMWTISTGATFCLLAVLISNSLG